MRRSVEMENFIPMLEREKFEKVPPNEFKDDPIRALVFHTFALVATNFICDVTRRNAA